MGFKAVSDNVISAIEHPKKAEIYISTVREQKGLGTTDIRQDGYHNDYKVLVRQVVTHSRPASVGSLTFVFFPVWQSRSWKSPCSTLQLKPCRNFLLDQYDQGVVDSFVTSAVARGGAGGARAPPVFLLKSKN